MIRSIKDQPFKECGTDIFCFANLLRIHHVTDKKYHKKNEDSLILINNMYQVIPDGERCTNFCGTDQKKKKNVYEFSLQVKEEEKDASSRSTTKEELTSLSLSSTDDLHTLFGKCASVYDSIMRPKFT